MRDPAGRCRVYGLYDLINGWSHKQKLKKLKTAKCLLMLSKKHLDQPH